MLSDSYHLPISIVKQGLPKWKCRKAMSIRD
nr:MAG TPA: hypothetical protein [Caudoviricetes sp.]